MTVMMGPRELSLILNKGWVLVGPEERGNSDGM